MINALKALFELACKPLRQDAQIRSTRDAENLISPKLCRNQENRYLSVQNMVCVYISEAIILQSRADLSGFFFELTKINSGRDDILGGLLRDRTGLGQGNRDQSPRCPT